MLKFLRWSNLCLLNRLHLQITTKWSSLRKAFMAIDKNFDGYIQIGELHQTLQCACTHG